MVSVPGVYIGASVPTAMGAFMNKGLSMKTGQTHVHKYMEKLMKLIEEGKVRLTDPVSRFIPAFAEETVAVTPARTVAASRAITIRDLLTPTSGIDSPPRLPTAVAKARSAS